MVPLPFPASDMLTGMLPRSTAALASLDMSKRALASTSADGKLRAEHAYLAGAVSGVAESLGFAPFQVIKVRCQQSGGGGEEGKLATSACVRRR